MKTPAYCTVRLWDEEVGVLAPTASGTAFEYTPEWLARHPGVSLSPIRLPAQAGRVFESSDPRSPTWQGLPGVFADCLPDRFGNAVIRQYFARKGVPDAELTALQKLLYIGTRGMGALEFLPPHAVPAPHAEEPLAIARLVEESRRVIAGDLDVAAAELMRLSASAGGARPKGLIAWNPSTNEVRSGLLPALPEGFERWIIKFDAVEGGNQPGPFGRLEWAYGRLARAAGLALPEQRLLEEGGRAHFMVRRFDRTSADGKRHMVSLCGLLESDFNVPGSLGYEDWFRAVRATTRDQRDRDEAVRRMVFNVMARNQDDHTKNQAFLMDRDFRWSLAPAYDITYANGAGFTAEHQMTVAGKRTDFDWGDLVKAAAVADVPEKRLREMREATASALETWPAVSTEAGLDRWPDLVREVGSSFRFPMPVRVPRP